MENLIFGNNPERKIDKLQIGATIIDKSKNISLSRVTEGTGPMMSGNLLPKRAARCQFLRCCSRKMRCPVSARGCFADAFLDAVQEDEEIYQGGT